jgi:hypothetical protein
MIEVFVNDKIFTNFTSLEIYKSMLDIAHKVNISYKQILDENGQSTSIIDVNNKVEIYVDGSPTFIGYLTPDKSGGGKSESVDFENKTHPITASLQDIFGFLETNKLSKAINHNAPIDILQVLEDILKECNYNKLDNLPIAIDVQKDITGREIDLRIKEKDKMSSEVGIIAAEHLRKFLQRKQILCYSDGISRLNLSKTGIDIIEGANIISNKNSNSNETNTCISIERNSGNQLAYGTCEFISVNNIKQLRGKKPSQVSSNNKYVVELKNALPIRKTVVMLRMPTSAKDLEKIGNMMAGNSKKNEEELTCIVPGFYANKENKIRFEVNKLIFVSCDYLKIYDYMLIQEVRHIYSPESQSFTTQLTLIDKKGIDVESIKLIDTENL